jgi:formylglycine-generating enzyme required for sulfatase activity
MAGMAYFSGGAFTMGQTPEAVAAECGRLGAACSRDLLQREQPARVVRLSPFFLDEVEVTNQDYAAFLNLDPRALRVKDDDIPPMPEKNRWVTDSRDVRLLDLRVVLDQSVQEPQGIRYAPVAAGHHFDVVPGKERWPAVQVTWDGARSFCESRGKRLPTEAEWEWAARGKGARPYPWGDAPPACEAVVFGRFDGGPCATLPRHPEPVSAGAQDVTPEGAVRDLGGNVSEWTADWFGQGVYGSCRNPECRDERVDPPSAEQDPDPFMVVRGSSFLSDRYLRTTRRIRWHRRSHATSIGFRCAMTVPER